ncbi:hypothetical protein U8Z98_003812 [Stenotrophomonas maltophilia]|uniref:Uncharacterized protein n=1 Tax=Stenotrophomonas maltophilia TaxID=40324 RepID=A0AAI9CL49_STEMA|nr:MULTISPECIES: DUF6631 family protein [Stenotrophomonas]EKZ1927414.1 hypothetical protein [Stenotrophomonas maltophilia]EMB2747357.1 hypothetical protein [Stenotrophomonas maltophilia]MDH2180135.1 hypothetical protein [Stenotrophomonas sp. GD03654]HEL7672988.1 hypothetical protein [Stenotrophomonas maltophilia]
MATRIGNQDQLPSESGSPDSGAVADELDILAAQQQGQVDGKTIIVREYGFFEGARILPLAAPLLADLQPLFEGSEPASMLEVTDVLLSHPDLIRHLLACAIAPAPGECQDAAAEVRAQEGWLETLNETDGEQMLLLWWQANGNFLLRRLLRNAVGKRVSQSAMDGSSPT